MSKKEYLIDRYIQYMETVNNCKFTDDERYELFLEVKYNGFDSIIETLLDELKN